MNRFYFFSVLFFAFLVDISAQTIAYQGFEPTGSTWSCSPSPARYNGQPTQDVWDDTTGVAYTGGLTAAVGSWYWFCRDNQNPTTGDALFTHYLDLPAVSMSGYTNASLSFQYFSVGYDAADSIGYYVAYDNGTTWGSPVYLSKSTTGWTPVVLAVPNGSTHARLRLFIKQNGGDDFAGFDDVKIEASAVVIPNITFSSATNYTQEGVASVTVTLNTSAAPTSNATVNIVANAGSSAGVASYSLSSTSVTFPAGSTASQSVTLTINDDATVGNGKFLALDLQGAVNANIGSANRQIVFIKDNDDTAPVADANAGIALSYVGNLDLGNLASSEISAYDPISKRIFSVNSLENKLHIVDFSNPAALTEISAISLATYGAGINSVDVRNGVVAIAVENATGTAGKVVFLDANGVYINQVTVGFLPDMITFSPDGNYVLTANEGEPTASYSIDPVGSISIVDISNGIASATVTDAGFASFDGQIAALRAAGIRIYGGGGNSNVAQDLEPEYIAFSSDGSKAYVALQENNAIAVLDMATKMVTAIRPLGYKDHSVAGNSIDASDNSAEIFQSSWKLKGMYQPDAMSSFSVGATDYLITANEGDARAYTGINNEEVRISALTLDPTAFPNGALLKNNLLLGRLRVTNKTGDTDNDGDFDELYTYGARSFSIWNATTGALVYDSGNDLEQIVAAHPTWGALFNASHDANSAKNRSDDKGPEPESVTVVKIEGNMYAFIGLERIGGIMVYNINNPVAPQFLQYINTRTTTGVGGDLGPEGLIFIDGTKSPNGKPYLIVSNEISGTIGVFEIGINCNGVPGVDPLTTFYNDSDNDTYGVVTPSVLACTAPIGYTNNTTDCNDSNAAINPDATEICDETDNNCNTLIDDNAGLTYYIDTDSDAFGNIAINIVSCDVPVGYVLDGNDCDDTNAAIKPIATEICDNIDNNCDNVVDNIASALCSPPTGLSTSNITSTKANINWSPAACGVSTRIQFRRSNTNAWTYRNATAQSGSTLIYALTPANLYYYRAKTFCAGAASSALSSQLSFNTLSAMQTFASDQVDGEIVQASRGITAVSVWPNPSSDMITIALPEGQSDCKLTDLSGRVLLQWSANGNTQADIRSLPIGIYILGVSSPTNNTTLTVLKK